MKINLFIIGSAKCGTTYLRNILRSHPNIHSIDTELHYFDLNYNNKNYLNETIFVVNNTKNIKLILDCSPSYSVIKPVAKRIYDIINIAKLFFVLETMRIGYYLI